MKVKFWGVRGSIPAPLTPYDYKSKIKEILSLASKSDISSKKKIDEFISDLPNYLQTTYGGNTSCVTITSDEVSLILDAGSGLRLLGSEIINGKFKNLTKDEYHIFLSHLHWDHINGLPFFIPLHMENTKINFYSPHENCERMLSAQQNAPFFPVTLASRPAEIEFHSRIEGQLTELKDLKISLQKLDHPNDSYAYRIKDKYGSSVVYATDCEYKNMDKVDTYVDFYKDADILIFDSQYSSNDLSSKSGFGHSSNQIGIDLAVKSNVKKIVFFHHNHDYDDKTIEDNLRISKEYCKEKYPLSCLKIAVANEDMEISV